MNKIDLDVAIEEAKRFIKKAEACKGENYVKSGKPAAACKRASMDLSRALADLRNPYRKRDPYEQR